MAYIITAIDNNTDFHTVAKFMRHIDTNKALGNIKLKSNVVECIGYWEGILETSYIMTREVYEHFVLKYGFTDNQECVMFVPKERRQTCALLKPDLTYIESSPPLVHVPAAVAFDAPAWTYNKEMDAYFVSEPYALG